MRVAAAGLQSRVRGRRGQGAPARAPSGRTASPQHKLGHPPHTLDHSSLTSTTSIPVSGRLTMSHDSTPLSPLSMNRPLPNSPSSWRTGPPLNQHTNQHSRQPSPEVKRYQLSDNPLPPSPTNYHDSVSSSSSRARPRSVIGSSTVAQYQQPLHSDSNPDRPSIRRAHKSAQSLSSLSSILRPQSPASTNPSPSIGFHSPQMERGHSETRFGHRSNTISANTSPLLPHSMNGSPDLRGMTSSPSSFSGGWAGTGHGREYEDIQNRTFCKW